MNKKEMKVVHQNEDLKKETSTDETANNLYEVLKELPKPNPNMKLNAAQKKWWYWFGFEFIETKQFSKVDLIHLQQASFWMDARSKAIAAANKKGINGLVQTFTSGATNVTGYVSIIEKADKHLAEVSAHFGLSIKDRKKLGEVSSAGDGQLDLFDAAFKKLHG